MIVTPEAAAWIAKRGDKICLFVTRGGCTGLMYQWSRDTTLAEVLVCSAGGIEVHTDQASLPMLESAVISLKKGILGRGLEVSNPDAEASCRCSRSFVMRGVEKDKLKTSDRSCGK